MQKDGLISPPSAASEYADDRQLVAEMLTRDAVAWQFFINRYGRVIRCRAADVAASFGYSTDASAIDDATADVFAALLANDCAALRAFAGRSSLVTYLAIIATRCTTRNFARKRYQGRVQTHLPDEAVVIDGNNSDPASGMLEAEQKTRIAALLAELPEKQRDVVRLYHLEGQSYADISQRLGIPLGSVGVTLQRAEARLRQCMETES